jgi:hypothetical protein
VKQRRKGDDWRANEWQRRFRTEVGETGVGERELRWRGNENFNPLQPVFNPKRKEKKKQKKKIKKLPFHVGRSAAVVRNECKNHFS